jgi:hypothetical protein
MDEGMDLQPLPSRHLVAYASADAFAEGTISILARLGYEIISPEKFEKLVENGEAGRVPDLLLVDERRLRELPRDGPTSRVPVLVLAAHAAAEDADERVVAAMKPPIGMHDLYRVVQQILEDRPRSSLRANTSLDAVCRRSGREWNARVVSLSENGCLLESPEPVPLGTPLQLAFELPGVGTVHVLAETAYHLHPNLGLVFSSISPKIRTSIAAFVTETLLADEARRTG